MLMKQELDYKTIKNQEIQNKRKKSKLKMKEYMSTFVFMKDDPEQCIWKVIWKWKLRYKVCRIEEDDKFQTKVIPIHDAEEFDKSTIHASSAKKMLASGKKMFANDEYHQCISKEFFDDIQQLIKEGCKMAKNTTYSVVRNDATETEQHDYTDDSVDLYMKDLTSFTIDGIDLKEKYSRLSAFPVVLLVRRYILDSLTRQKRVERTIRAQRRYTLKRDHTKIQRNLDKDIESDRVCKKLKLQ